VTTIQSSYIALSGPVYTAYWNLYYNVRINIKIENFKAIKMFLIKNLN
jgi:hypothetical protein